MTNKDLEKRILEQLKKKVFERDEQLKNHQNDKSVRDATKEALADMTSLNNEDVEALYQKIRKDEYAKVAQDSARKKSRRNIIIVVLILLAGIAGYFIVSFLKPKPVYYNYSQNFDAPKQSDFIDDKKYTNYKRIENGELVFASTKVDWCYWNSSKKIIFPKKYTVTANSEWQSGSFGTYGITFINNNKNYMSFSINQKGAANAVIQEEGEYTFNEWNYKVFPRKTKKHTQKIVVDGNNFAYYVDDKLVRKGNEIGVVPFKYVGCRICDDQTVAFDNIKIVNDETGEVILNQTFDKATPELTDEWDLDEKMKYEFLHSGGVFVMDNRQEDYCNRTEAYLPEMRNDKNWSISIDAKWLEGSDKDFGLLFITDQNEVVEFMFKKNGKVTYKQVNSEFKVVENSVTTPTNFNSTGAEVYRLKMKYKEGKKLQFFINDKKVLRYDANFSNHIEKLGMIVCGEQKVTFDNLIYEQLE